MHRRRGRGTTRTVPPRRTGTAAEPNRETLGLLVCLVSIFPRDRASKKAKTTGDFTTTTFNCGCTHPFPSTCAGRAYNTARQEYAGDTRDCWRQSSSILYMHFSDGTRHGSLGVGKVRCLLCLTYIPGPMVPAAMVWMGLYVAESASKRCSYVPAETMDCAPGLCVWLASCLPAAAYRFG